MDCPFIRDANETINELAATLVTQTLAHLAKSSGKIQIVVNMIVLTENVAVLQVVLLTHQPLDLMVQQVLKTDVNIRVIIPVT